MSIDNQESTVLIVLKFNALCNEIQLYKKLLHMAVNIDAENEKQSLDETNYDPRYNLKHPWPKLANPNIVKVLELSNQVQLQQFSFLSRLKNGQYLTK